jgi:hypothetical protein
MTSEFTRFDNWLKQWLAQIEKAHASAECTPPEKTTSADEQEGSAHANPTVPGNLEKAA